MWLKFEEWVIKRRKKERVLELTERLLADDYLFQTVEDYPYGYGAPSPEYKKQCDQRELERLTAELNQR